MDSEHNDGAEDARETPAAGAGAQLRAAREELRLDLTHIAAETRIPVRHLQTIEAGNFEALPSRAYAIGFARTFATAVGLDPAAITDVVRGELSDGSMRRTTAASGMEPGDPARLPSAGLAWAGVVAALVLAVGVFAFYDSYFGAGTEPGSLLTPATGAAPPSAAQPIAAAKAPLVGGQVVLTALEEGIWVRLYEEGGERLLERTLKLGETVLVPGGASDPRINTGRPDALAITIGGKSVAKLADNPTTLSGEPVSAAALLARTTLAPEQAATQTTSAGVSPGLPRSSSPRAATRQSAPQLSASAARSGLAGTATQPEVAPVSGAAIEAASAAPVSAPAGY